MIRILHFGDMHLDSPFSGVSPSKSEKLRAGLRGLFTEIMESAAEYDAVLIAGDLFDCAYISSDTVGTVKSVIEKSGKPVIIAPGNHDPFVPGGVWTASKWPDNCMIFGESRVSRFDFDTQGGPVTVWGWAFTSDRMEESPIKYGILPVKNRINILLGHCDFNSPITKYCPVTAGEIASSGCVYAALGHVHKFREPVICGGTIASYCGFPQGRSWDEPGEGGIMSVEIGDDGKVNLNRIASGDYRYECIDADITGADSDAYAESVLLSAAANISNASVRFTLGGAVPPDYAPDVKKIAEAVEKKSDGVSVQIIDRTLPVYGAEYLENDMTVRGEFYRSLLPGLTSDSPEERQTAVDALRYGLLALSDRLL